VGKTTIIHGKQAKERGEGGGGLLSSQKSKVGVLFSSSLGRKGEKKRDSAPSLPVAKRGKKKKERAILITTKKRRTREINLITGEKGWHAAREKGKGGNMNPRLPAIKSSFREKGKGEFSGISNRSDAKNRKKEKEGSRISDRGRPKAPVTFEEKKKRDRRRVAS